MPANTAIHIVALPKMDSTKNIALIPSALTMFAEAALHIFDGLLLVLGQQVAVNVREPNLGRDRTRGTGVVACEHDGPHTPSARSILTASTNDVFGVSATAWRAST